ncbi:hypothetical protein B0H16DRAFT_1467312 [Mycena metata]|uniref:Uncharacterized protein n=1 Tax=Mycena metata TaxID=1033252 RepID=A0AAD7MXF5_9AGAR|nr:hypothetical protein B0H16DRAFT_1467312 [Mycena metata]
MPEVPLYDLRVVQPHNPHQNGRNLDTTCNLATYVILLNNLPFFIMLSGNFMHFEVVRLRQPDNGKQPATKMPPEAPPKDCPEKFQISASKSNFFGFLGLNQSNIGQGLSRGRRFFFAAAPTAQRSAFDFLASKIQFSVKEIAKFGSQKSKFSDNPLVELPGASSYESLVKTPDTYPVKADTLDGRVSQNLKTGYSLARPRSIREDMHAQHGFLPAPPWTSLCGYLGTLYFAREPRAATAERLAHRAARPKISPGVFSGARAQALQRFGVKSGISSDSDEDKKNNKKKKNKSSRRNKDSGSSDSDSDSSSSEKKKKKKKKKESSRRKHDSSSSDSGSESEEENRHAKGKYRRARSPSPVTSSKGRKERRSRSTSLGPSYCEWHSTTGKYQRTLSPDLSGGSYGSDSNSD